MSTNLCNRLSNEDNNDGRLEWSFTSRFFINYIKFVEFLKTFVIYKDMQYYHKISSQELLECNSHYTKRKKDKTFDQQWSLTIFIFIFVAI